MSIGKNLRSSCEVRARPCFVISCGQQGESPSSTYTNDWRQAIAHHPAEEQAIGRLRLSVSQLAATFEMSPAEIDRTRPLAELGMDSLMAVELKSRIETHADRAADGHFQRRSDLPKGSPSDSPSRSPGRSQSQTVCRRGLCLIRKPHNCAGLNLRRWTNLCGRETGIMLRAALIRGPA